MICIQKFINQNIIILYFGYDHAGEVNSAVKKIYDEHPELFAGSE